MSSLQIIYASTSGHTEYVVQQVEALCKKEGWEVRLTKAEQATIEDFASSDLLLLASGTWNTGGIEGQLNPHMHVLLNKAAKEVDLAGKNVAVLGLGDERYFYTCRAAEYLEDFVKDHGGTLAMDTLRVINEPYGQEEKITKWGEKFVQAFSSAS